MNKGMSHHFSHFRALFHPFRARRLAGGAPNPMPPTWLDLPLDRASFKAPATLPHGLVTPSRGDSRQLKAALDLLARAIDAARMT